MSTTITAQFTTKQNIRLVGPSLGKQTIGTPTQFTKREVYIIVQMYKRGILHRISTEPMTEDIGRVSEDDIEMMFAEPPTDIITTTVTTTSRVVGAVNPSDALHCSALTQAGVPCTRNATGDDKLCKQHRVMKNAGKLAV